MYKSSTNSVLSHFIILNYFIVSSPQPSGGRYLSISRATDTVLRRLLQQKCMKKPPPNIENHLKHRFRRYKEISEILIGCGGMILHLKLQRIFRTH